MYIAYIQLDVIMVYVTYIHTESLIENNGELFPRFPPCSTLLYLNNRSVLIIKSSAE